MEENIADALLMAASVLIFVIALTVVFSLISQAKTTADTVLYSYDDTKYYIDDLEGITFTTANESDRNRTVNMETIIPTVYRYAKEHYGVTIFDKDGTIIARFDETTESIVQNWPNYLTRNIEACEKHYNYLKDLAIAANLGNEFENKYKDNVENKYDKLTKLWEEIYSLTARTSGNVNILYGTPWLGTESQIAQRLNSDFGKENAVYSTGTHSARKLLEKYDDKNFREIYLFISDDSGIEKDELTGDSVVVQSTTTKLEIIYVLKDD